MPETSKDRPVVMVSSTALDLPEHRKEVLDACLRQSTTPVMQEHLPASGSDAESGAEAVRVSLGMVDEAEIYVGIFAYRYGYVPAGRDISITEMEYDRAVERGITRLVFLMHDDHPVRPSNVETGAGAEKLKRLKERLTTENVVNFFNSPADLRAHVINSLSQYRAEHDKRDVTTFHYVSDIPAPPQAFIAHPYTLLQTHRLVGRQPELNLLTDWVAKPDSEVYGARVLNVVAVGGMGKSALTWKWFNDIAPQEMNPLAGRLWWSFYESDATFENFVTRALAYVTRRPLAEVQQSPVPDREAQLLAALDREPFLLVLDGLERILIAYARMDAARLKDNQVGNQTSLRKSTDPRAGRFLKKLTQLGHSRILVSTRLYPAELETEGGDPAPGSFRHDITGLTDEDAVELWRALKITGARDLLLPVFTTFDKHPLLIQALAGEVKRYRRAPGDFEEWRRANPRFDPTRFPHLQDAMSHVMEFALRGLDGKARQVLQIVAAFRMPARYDTLAALAAGEGKACADERGLDVVLNELEDRGLVGWDTRANRYDLHPIVRGVVWGGLNEATRRGVYTSLREHFEAVPRAVKDEVGNLEELTPAIELYNTLIGLGLYDDARKILEDHLSTPLFVSLGSAELLAELTEMLFPGGVDKPPALSDPKKHVVTMGILGIAYVFSGRLGQGIAELEQALDSAADKKDLEDLFGVQVWLAHALRISGSLRRAEALARRSLKLVQANSGSDDLAIGRHMLGSVLVVRGESELGIRYLQNALKDLRDELGEVWVVTFLAQQAMWSGDYQLARSILEQVQGAPKSAWFKSDELSITRLQGMAELGLNLFTHADELLQTVLKQARQIHFLEEEAAALTALAESRRRQGDLKVAREMLDDVWEAAERAPYPLIHADACNVLAEVERDEGNHAKAVEAATKAFKLTWCDGPPFAYHWGLEKARGLLRELGAGEPELPAFDASKFEPMPEAELDPEDEAGAKTVEVEVEPPDWFGAESEGGGLS